VQADSGPPLPEPRPVARLDPYVGEIRPESAPSLPCILKLRGASDHRETPFLGLTQDSHLGLAAGLPGPPGEERAVCCPAVGSVLGLAVATVGGHETFAGAPPPGLSEGRGRIERADLRLAVESASAAGQALAFEAEAPDAGRNGRPRCAGVNRSGLLCHRAPSARAGRRADARPAGTGWTPMQRSRGWTPIGEVLI